ncbi:MAG TPA: hypothetical protein DCL73_10590 [Treponema sp.]|nr:hypothetical protein [Treponema sp.]
MTINTIRPDGIPPADPVTIIAAAYGTMSAGADVTPVVRDIVRGGSLAIPVSNETLGGDPVPGVQKHFGVVYAVKGRTYARAALEGETIKLD